MNLEINEANIEELIEEHDERTKWNHRRVKTGELRREKIDKWTTAILQLWNQLEETVNKWQPDEAVVTTPTNLHNGRIINYFKRILWKRNTRKVFYNFRNQERIFIALSYIIKPFAWIWAVVDVGNFSLSIWFRDSNHGKKRIKFISRRTAAAPFFYLAAVLSAVCTICRGKNGNGY